MNETINSLLNRRSIRSYKKDPVSPEDVKTLLDVCLYAPSGMNTQPWFFTVIEDRGLLDRMNAAAVGHLIKNTKNPDALARYSAPGYDIFHGAPAAFMISAETKSERGEASVASDCGGVAATMQAAAYALGLGSCIIGMATIAFETDKNEEFRKALQIPDGYTPLYAVVFGKPEGEHPEARPRREGLVAYVK